MEPIFPFTLGTIAAIQKKKGWRVRGVDLFFDPADMVLSIMREERIDLVGIDVASDMNPYTADLCRNIQSLQPVRVVALGEYATLAGKDLFALIPGIEATIRGDAEYAFSEVCQALTQNRDYNIKGVLNRQTTRTRAGELALINNLDDLPFPDRDSFSVGQYANGMLTRQKIYAQIVTSRGCVHKCSYCAESVIGQPYRVRSPQNIVDEMAHLVDKYGIREFHVEDKNFIGHDIKRIKGLCALIGERPDTIEWQCAGVIPLSEMTDLNVIDAMASAGCYSISLGVESFHDTLTQRNRRRQSSQTVADVVQRCKDLGVEICCSLIFGLPGQTLSEVKADIRQSRRFDFDFIHYNIFKPLMSQSSGKALPSDEEVLKHKRWQMWANVRLIFKFSVFRFILRRLVLRHNRGRFVKKIRYYLFGEKKVHVA